MTLTITDVTDPTFLRLPDDTDRQAYLDQGLSQFSALCVKAGVDESLIPAEAPYTPKRLAVVCTLVAMLSDLIGSDFREVVAGVTIDVYKAKLDVLTKELNTLFMDLTPKLCGYDDGTLSPSSSRSFTWGRA